MKRAGHVTPNHLLEYLRTKGCFSKTQEPYLRPWRVGVCVSGGPDSMALAYLLRHVPHPFVDGLRAFTPYAFVIDHGARDGSHQEALWVMRELKNLGIDTYMQKLEWHSDVDPKSLKGFEMRARDERYRALVKLATANRIRDLFTGHHEDDQVETLMLRLLRDKTLNPLSFRGMTMTSTVPASEESQPSGTFSYPCHSPDFWSSHSNCRVPSRQESYEAGMQLHRPLLKYRKDQLIATCEYFKVPYVQDKSNFNPQLTPRNAIRNIRTHCKLPKALRREHLLNLCTKANKIYTKMEEHAHRFLINEVLHMHLDSETGVLVLCLKALRFPMTEAETQGFAFFMQRAISLVSPLKDESMPSMLDRDNTQQMYALCAPHTAQGWTEPKTLVYNQVVCERIQLASSYNHVTLSFARQPFPTRSIPSLTQGFDLDASSSTTENGLFHSQWILWDRRFWIRVHGGRAAVTETTVRPCSPSDLRIVKKLLKEAGRLEKFQHILRVYASGNIRYTLPVLVASGKVIAFPTLHISVDPITSLSWQVLYRQNRTAYEFFFPGIKHRDTFVWDIGSGPYIENGAKDGLSVPNSTSTKFSPRERPQQESLPRHRTS